jgi:hypothetical protein
MMRKGCLLLTLVLIGPGCLSSGTHVAKESRQAPPVQMTTALPSRTPPPPPVTADQITEANASEKAQELARELDYEVNNQRTAPAPRPIREQTMNP